MADALWRCSKTVRYLWSYRQATPVGAARFRGTCYRAANWIHVGQTTGRGRMDRAPLDGHYAAVRSGMAGILRELGAHSPRGAQRYALKDIYIYPLVCDARERLCES